MNRNKIFKDKLIFIIIGGVLEFFCISLVIPFIWMFYSSFKSPLEFLLRPFDLPTEWHYENFLKIFSLLKVEILTEKGKVLYGLEVMLVNSFIFASGCSFMGVLLPALMAYAISKYNFRFKKLIFNIAILTMVIPIVGNMPSSLAIRNFFGILNNPILFILTSAQPFGFTFLLLYGMFKGLSWSYAEATFIDGGGHFTVFFKVMLPLAMPSLATVFILGFIGNWNDYMTILIYLPKFPNLAYGVYSFQYEAARYGASPPEVLAGLIIAAIPSAVLYLSSQKLILSRFTIGGLKG